LPIQDGAASASGLMHCSGLRRLNSALFASLRLIKRAQLTHASATVAAVKSEALNPKSETNPKAPNTKIQNDRWVRRLLSQTPRPWAAYAGSADWQSAVPRIG